MMKNKSIPKNVTMVVGLLIAVVFITSFARAAETCFDVGENYAKQNNVSVVAAKEALKDGRAVCEVVVLREASNGNRPKREVVYLPL
ncbi:MAG: hypothetical protein U5K75_01445 [Ahrensia sp.]|nr:hypothetical protein [Ahrensia sp.]